MATLKRSLSVKRLTVYLNADLDRRVRKRSNEEDRSLSTVAERAFRAYLAMSDDARGEKDKS